MILIDTGPLVALCDEADQHNERAARELEGLARERFAVCVPVLTEAFFHLRGEFLRERLKKLLRRMSVTALALDARDGWDKVFDWLERYSEHDPDFADGYLVVLCGMDKRLRVWTFDKQFSRMWRTADGSRIPLAVEKD